MLSKRTIKSHRVKWIEAERELATRGVLIPSHSISYEYFPIHNEQRLPQPDRVIDHRNRRLYPNPRPSKKAG